MPSYENLIGQAFGKLTVYEEYYDFDKKRWMVFCICDCGNITTTAIDKGSLKNGHTKSCGCLIKEKARIRVTTHGNSKKGKLTPEYRAWKGIRGRCLNPNNSNFHHYGGRGIKVCEKWNKFENFLEDMGRRPAPEYSIDRIDNNGDYCPENCRWATRKEQNGNRRDNVWLECDGIKMIKIDWLKELGIDHVFVDYRLKKNIPFPEIVKQAREHVLKKAIRHWGEDIRQDDFENGYGG